MRFLPETLSRLLRRSERANPVSGIDIDRYQSAFGAGGSWNPQTYGEYYPRSMPVYAGIKLRQDAIARVPLRVLQLGADDEAEWVGHDHPAQKLLDAVNPFWTRGDLWRATETYLGLWGSAYWSLVRDSQGRVTEIWPLRPDRMRPVPSPDKYVSGFVYVGKGQVQQAFAPDEIVWMRYFNPLDEYAGLSPIAPLRLSLDMSLDALRFNRNSLANDSMPGLFITSSDTPTEEEVKDFYARWEQRYQGVTKVRRPALLSGGMDVKNFGFSPREMEFLQSLRWSLADVGRAYNIPVAMLHDVERLTYANYATARKIFWEDCIVPQLIFYQERLQEMLLPHLEDGESLRVEFDTSKVEALQEDETNKATRRNIYLGAGVLTINEVRSEMGLEPVDWGDEDPRPSSGGYESFGLAMDTSANGHRRLRRAQAITQERGEQLEGLFRASLDKRERTFKTVMVKLFNEQMTDVLARLHGHRDAHPLRSPTGILEDLVAGTVDAAIAIKERDGEGLVLFEPDDWKPQFRTVGLPLFEQALLWAAQAHIKEFNLGVSFDVHRPIVQEWLEERVTWWANRVNMETGRLITQEITAANELGESIPQIAERMKKVDDVNTQVRALRIARTEMVGSQNEGHQQAYEAAGIEGKQWWTAQDERVRETHAAAHGQIRALRTPFDVGGEQLRTPGQGGSAANVVNCRCVQLPYFDKVE